MNKTTTAPQQKRKQRADYYQIVTDRIIALLDKGVPPWRKTWGSYGWAKNYATGHQYRGINMLMLNLVAPYDIPLYMSRKQIHDKGGRIIKGSKAEWVYFYGDYHKDESGKTVPPGQVESRIGAGENLNHIRFLKARPVYNVSCVEGIEIVTPERPIQEYNPIEECEVLLAETPIKPTYVTTDGDRAYYDKIEDRITIPNMKYFTASEEYYCTLFHELVHWSGHESRLARPGIVNTEAKLGTKLYSEEELIAEMGASYLCAITGIDREAVTENSAAYIEDWKSKLQEDKKLIFRVAAKAQQAIDFLTKKEN